MSTIKTIPIHQHPLWDQARGKRTLLSISLELTARCNNNCAHCYINLPANDPKARAAEISLEKIKEIIDESVSLGTLWVLLSGGEPLLREDFTEIYLYLKQKGMLVSVFTNATLISDEHIALFKKYPPREIEISVYGATPETHRQVTRKNTFAAFLNGINKLKAAGIPFVLKTTLMRANSHELKEIAAFCKTHSDLGFRFDPFLHLRLDRDPVRNQEIMAQRLTIHEILELEADDPARISALKKQCADLRTPKAGQQDDPGKLFRCVAGINSCCIAHDGTLKLCSSLTRKDCVYDLNAGSLTQGWQQFLPRVRGLRSTRRSYRETCGTCNLHDLCMWCPAVCDLETGDLDRPVPFFCDMALARFENY